MSIKFNYIRSGRKEDPPVVFLHGFMGCAIDWGDIISALSDKFHCVALDLPGHGQTVADDDSDYRMDNTAKALIAFLDELKIERCRIVGYSMGGRLAFYLAAHHADRIERMVIESASPGLKTEKQRKDRRDLDARLAGEMLSGPLVNFLENWYRQPLFATIDKSSDMYRQMLARRLVNEPHGLGRSLKMIGTGAQPPLWDKLSDIDVDMLLIVGEYDTKFRQIAREVAAKCRSADVALVAGAGHLVHLEKPDDYIREVRRFLTK